MSTDRIEKQILLRAAPERVWRAISDAVRFGSWFGVEFDGPFTEGARLTGKLHRQPWTRRSRRCNSPMPDGRSDFMWIVSSQCE
jgi:uncharacterized protein YndB with AHSA1/START domain